MTKPTHDNIPNDKIPDPPPEFCFHKLLSPPLPKIPRVPLATIQSPMIVDLVKNIIAQQITRERGILKKNTFGIKNI
jgi:hypothetical protein